MVSSLLSRCGVYSMEQVLAARVAALGPMTVSIDGGAGWGATSKNLADASGAGGRVHAFEPFPGNHRFFADADARIKLYPQAICEHAGRARFFVPRTVEAHDAWAERGFGGYSSLGHITTIQGSWLRALVSRLRRLRGRASAKAQVLDVDATRLDAALQEAHIDFVKLDLQGGELPALVGMGSLLAATDLLWVEFTGQAGLLDFLLDRGFLLFDTNYLCPDHARDRLGDFALSMRKQIVLSTNQPALLATRTRDHADFADWFGGARRAGAVMQTDLLAVNPAFVASFLAMLGPLGSVAGDGGE